MSTASNLARKNANHALGQARQAYRELHASEQNRDEWINYARRLERDNKALVKDYNSLAAELNYAIEHEKDADRVGGGYVYLHVLQFRDYIENHIYKGNLNDMTVDYKKALNIKLIVRGEWYLRKYFEPYFANLIIKANINASIASGKMTKQRLYAIKEWTEYVENLMNGNARTINPDTMETWERTRIEWWLKEGTYKQHPTIPDFDGPKQLFGSAMKRAYELNLAPWKDCTWEPEQFPSALGTIPEIINGKIIYSMRTGMVRKLLI